MYVCHGRREGVKLFSAETSHFINPQSKEIVTPCFVGRKGRPEVRTVTGLAR